MTARLEARGLACSRGPATLFRDLSFSIGAGEWLAVRGPNGSGKTTLLRCVAGLAHADAGETLWNDVATTREREAFRASLLYAGHLPGITDDLSAEENLQSSLALRGVAPDAAATPASTGAAAATKSVTGSVVAATALASRIHKDDTLFVYARAENGPRMPLAIIRGSAAQLPMKFALDDSQAMSPAMKLSSANAVRIEARVSRSGNAMPQAGDIVGTSGIVQPGARDVKIVLDKVVP